MAKKSAGDRLREIEKLKGTKKNQAINEAVREGISLTKISDAAGTDRRTLIDKLADKGW